jgi:hypothetical protein
VVVSELGKKIDLVKESPFRPELKIVYLTNMIRNWQACATTRLLLFLLDLARKEPFSRAASGKYKPGSNQ